MRNFYLPLALVVGGNLLYHVSQKTMPKDVHPLYTMSLVYLIGICICVAGALLLPGEKSFAGTLKESNWWSIFAMALGVVAVEIGFLLAYRVGWNISLASITSSVAVTLLLLPIGILAFKEQLSGRNVIGLLLCLIGLILVTKK
ncbi:MAG: DMT family transporter [Pyrinomonadaceae bacterium]